ncbi:MAG: tRNA (guanosine(46)-N7)-methyltransferase TrmB [Tannerella sp.]|jgi:tRNA (guanine-N7-)-methyltransferase|nr:tRNA (guanosine(46)-N7)-methyltransferase TrmB [Tannerella sp.]
MGKKKLQKFNDMTTFSNVFQYPYAKLRDAGGFPLKGSWNEACFGNHQPIVLELGCGKGEYTVGLGRLFPDRNFIGIDIKGARMWTGAKEATEKEMKNVAFLRTDIGLITDFFGKGEVSEIWITFPDPQMKKVNKRLTGTRFLNLYNQILAKNGIIHLKTDSNFMFSYTKELIKVNDFKINVCTENLYSKGISDKILGIKTCYERQWIDRGLNIKYIQFISSQRKKLVEPDVEIEPDTYRSYNRFYV